MCEAVICSPYEHRSDLSGVCKDLTASSLASELFRALIDGAMRVQTAVADVVIAVAQHR